VKTDPDLRFNGRTGGEAGANGSNKASQGDNHISWQTVLPDSSLFGKNNWLDTNIGSTLSADTGKSEGWLMGLPT